MVTESMIEFSPGGTVCILEDNGIVYSTVGDFPDSEEIGHVEAFHAGKYCPISDSSSVGVPRTYCEDLVITGNELTRPCFDTWKAGTW